jgi:hypothetical protein
MRSNRRAALSPKSILSAIVPPPAVSIGSNYAHIACAILAALLIEHGFVLDHLRWNEHAGANDVFGVNKHVSTAVVGLNKSEASILIEHFNNSGRHNFLQWWLKVGAVTLQGPAAPTASARNTLKRANFEKDKASRPAGTIAGSPFATCLTSGRGQSWFSTRSEASKARRFSEARSYWS